MDITICPAAFEDKPVLRNLLELYQHDFSEYDDAEVDEHGLYGYRHLDHYWTEPGRHAFLVRVSGKLAGFVMVRYSPGAGAHSIAEFFIMRKYRRQGLGRIVAHRVFDMFGGRWRVEQVESNHPAQAFWRTAISEYTNGRYEDISGDEHWPGPIQIFESRKAGGGDD